MKNILSNFIEKEVDALRRACLRLFISTSQTAGKWGNFWFKCQGKEWSHLRFPWWRSGWVHLPMQETWVQSLVLGDSTCCKATKPTCHSHWRCALEPASRKYWEPAHCNSWNPHPPGPVSCNHWCSCAQSLRSKTGEATAAKALTLQWTSHALRKHVQS